MHHAPCAIHAPHADSTSIHVLAPRHHAPVLRQRPKGALRGHQLTQWGTQRPELLGAETALRGAPGDHATGAPWEGDVVAGGWGMHIFCAKNQDSTSHMYLCAPKNWTCHCSANIVKEKTCEKDAWIEHDLDKCETKFTVITVYPKNKVQGRRFNQHLTHPKDPVYIFGMLTPNLLGW